MFDHGFHGHPGAGAVGAENQAYPVIGDQLVGEVAVIDDVGAGVEMDNLQLFTVNAAGGVDLGDGEFQRREHQPFGARGDAGLRVQDTNAEF